LAKLHRRQVSYVPQGGYGTHERMRVQSGSHRCRWHRRTGRRTSGRFFALGSHGDGAAERNERYFMEVVVSWHGFKQGVHDTYCWGVGTAVGTVCVESTLPSARELGNNTQICSPCGQDCVHFVTVGQVAAYHREDARFVANAVA